MTKESLIKQLETACYGLDPVDPLRLLVDDVIAALAQTERSESSGKPSAWVGLTDEDFQPMVQKAMAYYGFKPEHSMLTSGAGFYALVRNIEAKLKEKNT